MIFYHIFQAISMLQLSNPLSKFLPKFLPHKLLSSKFHRQYAYKKPVQNITNKKEDFQCDNSELCKNKQIQCPKK
jgi:hypothetical protein